MAPTSLNVRPIVPTKRMFVVFRGFSKGSIPDNSKVLRNRIFLNKKHPVNSHGLGVEVRLDGAIYLDNISIGIDPLTPLFKRIKISMNHMVVGLIR